MLSAAQQAVARRFIHIVPRPLCRFCFRGFRVTGKVVLKGLFVHDAAEDGLTVLVVYCQRPKTCSRSEKHDMAMFLRGHRQT
jgi:hypothetical protein